MNPNWLKKLRVENFKRFDVLDLEFGGINLLVGPNNSGKSTALQACALFNFCQSCLEKRNGGYVFQNRTFGPDEFFAVPAAEPKDLWKDRRVQRGNEAIPIRLSAELYSGDRFDFEIVLRFNRFSIQSTSATKPVTEHPSVILIPGYTDFWPREERRTPAVRSEMRAQSQHGGIIRNLLLDLRDNAQHWERFVNELATVFPTIHLLRPEFAEETDRYIKVGYTEDASVKSEKNKRAPADLDLFPAEAAFASLSKSLPAS
jgi:hypothetical protein